VHAFLGIPYAEAPIDRWRFLPPRAIRKQIGILDATRFGPASPQPLDDYAASLPDLGNDLFNEDSLNLNIWTAGLNGQMPVMVWIHGGGNTTGSSRRPDFDGARLAAKGVVVVSLNYRLGIFGFLDISTIGGPGYRTSANNGLLDQLCALKWVQTNISAFGGDPNNVAVFGNSAGASNISALLALPEPEQYFRRAIIQSGSASLTKSYSVARRISHTVFSRARVSSVDELFQRSPRELLEIQSSGVADLQELEKDLAFQPTVDGQLIKRFPLDAIRRGDAGGVDLIVGSTRNELRLYQDYTPALANAKLAEIVGVRDFDQAFLDQLWGEYRSARPRMTNGQVALDVGSDYWFRLPAIRMAEAQCPHNKNVYMYLFNWQATDPMLGAAHAVELPFVFGNFEHGRMARFIDANDPPTLLAAGRLVNQVQDYWTSFSLNGCPTTTDPGAWPKYDLAARSTMVFDRMSRIVDDPSAPERRLTPCHDVLRSALGLRSSRLRS